MIDNVGSLTGAAFGPSSGVRAPGSKMGKDEFLKLLVAQMSNQDPMNPMEGADFAAQLAQFSSVEQLIQLNTKLDAQSTAQAAMSATIAGGAAMSAFGRVVTAAGNQVQVVTGAQSSVRFQVGGAGGSGTLKIMDASGRVVASGPTGELASGSHTVALGNLTKDLPAGTYTYAVELQDATGAAVPVQTYTTGRVDGIRYGAEGPVLTSGGMTFPFGSIVEIVAEG